jgi:hypothetical protein
MSVCAIKSCGKPEHGEGLCIDHLRRAIGNLSINPEHMSRGVMASLKAVAHSSDATRYVDDTGLTVEFIRNATYCPRCGAGQGSKCLYSSHGEPVAHAKPKLHDERVKSAVERFGSGKRPNDTGDCR